MDDSWSSSVVRFAANQSTPDASPAAALTDRATTFASRTPSATQASADQLYVINGKFLRASPTGVHRVALELCHALSQLMAEGHPALAGCRFELWHSRDGRERAAAIDLPRREIGGGDGNLWEQLLLPLTRRRGTLISLCNVGPMLSRNAVTMIHDAQVFLTPQSYRPAFRRWYQTLLPILGRRNRMILTVSDYSREQLAAVGVAPLSRIHTVHNGIDHVLTSGEDPGVVARLGLAGQAYALGLANTQAHKNIGLLLRAFADPALAGVRLVLFGGATKADFIAAGHAVPDTVIFAGRVSDAELNSLYASALAIAFPSLTEGFGLPPLEAMQLGCPAVCAPCGALPEVCCDAALYADAHDPAAWVAAIARLASDPDHRRRLAEAGLRQAERFTWRGAALELVAALTGAASARQAAAPFPGSGASGYTKPC